VNYSNIVFKALVGFSAVVPAALISSFLVGRALPWWMDGGDWLKSVNAILGNTYPMWNQSTLQYPPLFLLFVADLSGLGEIRALEIAAIAAYSLIPLTTYFFVKDLLHDRIAGLASAWLTAFTPVWLEMFGWGGYPDLLGLAFLPLAFLGIVRYHRKWSTSNLTMLVLTSALIPITHHLTFITFVGVLVIWGILSALFDKAVLRPVALSFLSTLATFLAYRLAAGPWQFLFFNQAALYGLQAQLSDFLWMFKSLPLFTALYFSAFASAVLLVSDKRFRTEGLFLVAWILTPLLGTQGYQLGVSLDYSRVLFFIAQPLTILVAAPFAYRNEVLQVLRSGKIRQGLAEFKDVFLPGKTLQFGNPVKQILILGILVLSVIAVLGTPFIGAATLGNVNTYYSVTDPYGDRDKLQVANYIASTTPSNAVIVAETTAARWIEGYSQRRVLLAQDSRFLFLTGELERDYAATAIMFSYRGMRNGYAWIFDQAPYGPISPLISLYYHGAYTNTLVVNETISFVSWTNTLTGKSYNMSLTNSTSTESHWLVRNTRQSTIAVQYRVGPISVVREVSLFAGIRNVTLGFQASTNDSSVQIAKLKVGLVRWTDRSIFTGTIIANRSLLVTTDVGKVNITSSSRSAFPFVFIPSQSSNHVSGSVTVWNSDPGNASALFSYDRAQLVEEYDVKDVVVPKLYWVNVNQPIVTTVRAPLAYENLLKDPEFTVAYYNTRAIVLRVAS
jgi:hypothetical protein